MSNPTDSIDGMMSFLRMLAGLLIFAGFIATIWIWNQFGLIEVPTGRYSLPENEIHGPGVALAIAVGFQALLSGVLIFVFAHLVESVTRIEHAVTSQRPAAGSDEEQATQAQASETGTS